MGSITKVDIGNDEKTIATYDQKVDVPEAFVIDPVVEKKLMRRIDRRLFPMVWVMLLMNYIDRTNIGNAKVGGMAADFHMTSGGYSLVLSIFYVSYLLFEVPSNMALTHAAPRWYLPGLMAVWGSISIAAMGIHTTGAMAGFRFVLGAVEAGFYPGVSFLMSCWYKPEEMSRRMCFFYSSTLVAGAFGGLLAGGIIQGMEGLAGIRGWRWLFVIEGLATVVVAGIACFFLPNFPTNTRWITEEEKQIALHRLLAGAPAEDREPIGHWAAFKLALKDPKMWIMLITYNVIACSGTISYFIPTITSAMGYKGRAAQFMTVPIYAVAFTMSLSGGWIADKFERKAFVMMAAGTISTASYIVCATVQNPKVKYAFLCFGAAGVWTVIPIYLSWVVIMFDGHEKRAVCIAMVNGFGNLSSIYGSFFWPAKDAPRYVTGFAVTTSLCGALVLFIWFTYWRYGDKGVTRSS